MAGRSLSAVLYAALLAAGAWCMEVKPPHASFDTFRSWACGILELGAKPLLALVSLNHVVPFSPGFVGC